MTYYKRNLTVNNRLLLKERQGFIDENYSKDLRFQAKNGYRADLTNFENANGVFFFFLLYDVQTS